MASRFASRVLSTLLLAGLVCLPAVAVRAKEARVAVATNFMPVVDALRVDFEMRTGHTIRVSSGSTGKLYAQIVHGAPFDVFLAADAARPAALVDGGFAIASSQRDYAHGRLVLVSRDSARVAEDGRETLRTGDWRKLALANPELAPYGRAARETLVSLGLWRALEPRLVLGENIGQTFALVATGNAEVGLVALSQLGRAGGANRHGARATDVLGSHWLVPATLHRPIRQAAVLLRRGVENEAASAFLAFLASPSTRAVIREFGYGVE